MKLKESQLRSIIRQVVLEETVNSGAAVAKVQDAVNVLFEYAQAATEEIDSVRWKWIEAGGVQHVVKNLGVAAFKLENISTELDSLKNVLEEYNKYAAGPKNLNITRME